MKDTTIRQEVQQAVIADWVWDMNVGICGILFLRGWALRWDT